MSRNVLNERTGLAGAVESEIILNPDPPVELMFCWDTKPECLPPAVSTMAPEHRQNMKFYETDADWTDFTKDLGANGFKNAGWDPISGLLGHGDYSSSYRQATADGTWSMQISYNSTTHNIQIDIDKYNPSINFHHPIVSVKSLFGHAGNVAQGFFGKDTDYHAAANALQLKDTQWPQ